MAKLIDFIDDRFGCRSRVQLDNGELIWIRINNAGVLIKKSRFGIFGQKLFNVSEPDKLIGTIISLNKQINYYSISQDINNLVLRLFTQIALNCNTTYEIKEVLYNSLGSVDSLFKFYKTNSYENEKIISDYGSFLEKCNLRPLMEVRDANELPHKKRDIINAILYEITKEANQLIRESLKTGAVFLAYFQENIGNKPLTSEFNYNIIKDHIEDIDYLINEEKFTFFDELVNKELAIIMLQTNTAEIYKKYI
jgi:hypothetical protein